MLVIVLSFAPLLSNRWNIKRDFKTRDSPRHLHRYSRDLQLHVGVNRIVLWVGMPNYSLMRTNSTNDPARILSGRRFL
jgi:hypothetical protein